MFLCVCAIFLVINAIDSIQVSQTGVFKTLGVYEGTEELRTKSLRHDINIPKTFIYMILHPHSTVYIKCKDNPTFLSVFKYYMYQKMCHISHDLICMKSLRVLSRSALERTAEY